jgi:hypothetical protein
LSLAFKQAEALAAGGVEQYAERHREICARPRLMAQCMLTLETSAAWQRLALAGLEKWPGVFAALLKFHADGTAYNKPKQLGSPFASIFEKG